MIFDDELSFREHINCKVKKANSLAGIIRRSFLHMDKVMFKRLFVVIGRGHHITELGLQLENYRTWCQRLFLKPFFQNTLSYLILSYEHYK